MGGNGKDKGLEFRGYDDSDNEYAGLDRRGTGADRRHDCIQETNIALIKERSKHQEEQRLQDVEMHQQKMKEIDIRLDRILESIEATSQGYQEADISIHKRINTTSSEILTRIDSTNTTITKVEKAQTKEWNDYKAGFFWMLVKIIGVGAGFVSGVAGIISWIALKKP